MNERLPWQRFYRAAKTAGYELELPDAFDRADFRTKLTKYTGLDPRRNRIRPVYIKGREGQTTAEFFGRWHGDGNDKTLVEEKEELDRMIKNACVGERDVAIGLAHHKGGIDVLDRVAKLYDAPFLTFDSRPLFSYDEDRLVATFLKKAEK